MIGCYGTARPRSGAGAASAPGPTATGQFELSVPPGPTYVYIMDCNGQGRLSDQDVDRPRGPRPRAGPSCHQADGRRLSARSAIGRDESRRRSRRARAKAVGAQEAGPGKAGGMVAKAGRPGGARAGGPGHFLMGRVVDPEGSRSPACRSTSASGSCVQAATDRDGNFVLEGLPPGDAEDQPQQGGLSVLATRPPVADRESCNYVLTPNPEAIRLPAPAARSTLPPAWPSSTSSRRQRSAQPAPPAGAGKTSRTCRLACGSSAMRGSTSGR